MKSWLLLSCFILQYCHNSATASEQAEKNVENFVMTLQFYMSMAPSFQRENQTEKAKIEWEELGFIGLAIVDSWIDKHCSVKADMDSRYAYQRFV